MKDLLGGHGNFLVKMEIDSSCCFRLQRFNYTSISCQRTSYRLQIILELCYHSLEFIELDINGRMAALECV